MAYPVRTFVHSARIPACLRAAIQGILLSSVGNPKLCCADRHHQEQAVELIKILRQHKGF